MKTLLLAAALALAVPVPRDARPARRRVSGGAAGRGGPARPARRPSRLRGRGGAGGRPARAGGDGRVPLGEVHRKLGQTNEAVAQYRRLLRDFPAEETLARLSRENLGAPVAERGGDAPVAEAVRSAPPRDAGPETLIALQQAFPDEQLAKLEEAILDARLRHNALEEKPASQAPRRAGRPTPIGRVV